MCGRAGDGGSFTATGKIPGRPVARARSPRTFRSRRRSAPSVCSLPPLSLVAPDRYATRSFRNRPAAPLECRRKALRLVNRRTERHAERDFLRRRGTDRCRTRGTAGKVASERLDSAVPVALLYRAAGILSGHRALRRDRAPSPSVRLSFLSAPVHRSGPGFLPREARDSSRAQQERRAPSRCTVDTASRVAGSVRCASRFDRADKSGVSFAERLSAFYCDQMIDP